MKEIKSDFYNLEPRRQPCRAFLINFFNQHNISTKHEMKKKYNKMNSKSLILFINRIKKNFGKSDHKNFDKYLLNRLCFLKLFVYFQGKEFFLSFEKHSESKKNISEKLLTFLFGEND